jgi:hypothetical protein
MSSLLIGIFLKNLKLSYNLKERNWWSVVASGEIGKERCRESFKGSTKPSNQFHHQNKFVGN